MGREALAVANAVKLIEQAEEVPSLAELAAPFLDGRIEIVIDNLVRRSLRAIR